MNLLFFDVQIVNIYKHMSVDDIISFWNGSERDSNAVLLQFCATDSCGDDDDDDDDADDDDDDDDADDDDDGGGGGGGGGGCQSGGTNVFWKKNSANQLSSLTWRRPPVLPWFCLKSPVELVWSATKLGESTNLQIVLGAPSPSWFYD